MCMPWFAWIAIVAIVVFGVISIIGVVTGRPTPFSDEQDTSELERRLKELEAKASADELEAPTLPTRSEENLAAEDRWRLDMLEARLEQLERSAEDPESEKQ